MDSYTLLFVQVNNEHIHYDHVKEEEHYFC
jgi:hypothetical protein